jgi:hypothetical protein
MVGMVVTTSPSLRRYSMLVLPAASRPSMRSRVSRFPNSWINLFEMVEPMPVFFYPRCSKRQVKACGEKMSTTSLPRPQEVGRHNRSEHIGQHRDSQFDVGASDAANSALI